jgi:hypothetical protein
LGGYRSPSREPDNRGSNFVYLRNQFIELAPSRRIIGFQFLALQKRFEVPAIINLHHFDACQDRRRERLFLFDTGGRGLFGLYGCGWLRLARP